jgi:hypothetical protein
MANESAEGIVTVGSISGLMEILDKETVIDVNLLVSIQRLSTSVYLKCKGGDEIVLTYGTGSRAKEVYKAVFNGWQDYKFNLLNNFDGKVGFGS